MMDNSAVRIPPAPEDAVPSGTPCNRRQRNAGAPALLWLLVCSLFCSGLTAPAGEIAPGIRDGKNGTLSAAGVKIELLHYAAGWKAVSQNGKLLQQKPGTTGNMQTLEGVLETAAGPMQFREETTPANAAGLRGCTLSYSLSSATPVPTETAAIALTLPVSSFAGATFLYDGKPVVLPKEQKDLQVAVPPAVNEIRIPTASGTLLVRGENMKTLLQDNRQFKNESFTIRLILSGVQKDFTAGNLKISLFVEPYRVTPLDLSASVNQGFRDEVKEDGKGGWTDQGDNDLQGLPLGEQKLGGLNFRILDPAAHAGKSCLVFAGPQRDYFLKEAVLPVPASAKGAHWLYLLNASAWVPQKGEPVGTVVAEYADGSKSEHALQARIDVGDWWVKGNLDRGPVVWKGENSQSPIGLYLSTIELQNKPLKDLRLLSSGKAVWMVVAASLANAQIPTPPELPLILEAGKDWIPYTPDAEILPGSILDFSAMNPAPAGEHGPLVVRDGHFECEKQPGQRLKLVGANLCFSANFLEHADADKLAVQWQRMGYNTARLHHYDRELVGGWGAKRSDTIDAAKLEKFDYLFAQLKKAGMYVTIDLYTIRTFEADEIPGWDKPAFREIKPLLPILPGAFQAWSKMALQLLNHVNPYTGLAWKDDPAFFSICPINEDSIFAVWSSYPAVKELYLRKFAEWLKSKKLNPASDQERDALLAQFLIEVKVASNRQLAEFFKKNGVPALITGSNFISRQAQTFMREEFDFVDNHQYWDHPHFPVEDWRLPYGFHQRSVIRALAETPRGMMASRIFGKPFTVTEYNFTPPNRYRAEGGAVMGAYAALQDWDGLYRFAWSHSDKNATSLQPISCFDAATDPVSLLSERQIVLLFRRGDAAAAPQKYVYAVTMNEATKGGTGWNGSNFPQDFTKEGLLQQIGSQAVEEGKAIRGTFAGVCAETDPGETARAGNPYLAPTSLPGIQDKLFASGSGQIVLSPDANTLQVTTPKTACLVLPAGKDGQAGALAVSGVDQFCAISASAMDGQELTQSKRILVLHLTNVGNTGMRFSGESMTLLENWGKLPYLVQRGAAKIALKVPQGLKVWAVAPSGRRIAEIPATYEQGALIFAAQTAPEKSEPALAYEIAEK